MIPIFSVILSLLTGLEKSLLLVVSQKPNNKKKYYDKIRYSIKYLRFKHENNFISIYRLLLN